MIEILNQSGLDKDSSNKVANGYKDAQNILVGAPIDGNADSVKRQYGNEQVQTTSRPVFDGTVVGSYEDKEADKVYFFVKNYTTLSTEGNYIASWTPKDANAQIVFKSNKLDFSGEKLNGIFRVGETLYWNDPGSRPGWLMLDQISNFGSFSDHQEEYTSDAKRPPVTPLRPLGLYFKNQGFGNKSSIPREGFGDNYTGIVFFSYKYIYKDGSESIWAPPALFNLEENLAINRLSSQQKPYYLATRTVASGPSAGKVFDYLTSYNPYWVDGETQTLSGVKAKSIALPLLIYRVHEPAGANEGGVNFLSPNQNGDIDDVLRLFDRYEPILDSIRVAYKYKPDAPYRIIKDVKASEIKVAFDAGASYYVRFDKPENTDLVDISETSVATNRMPIKAKAMTFVKNAKVFGNVTDEYEDFTKPEENPKWIDFSISEAPRDEDSYTTSFAFNAIEAGDDAAQTTNRLVYSGSGTMGIDDGAIVRYDRNSNTAINGLVDGAFYVAKRAGTNRVHLFRQEPTTDFINAIQIGPSITGTHFLKVYHNAKGRIRAFKNDSSYKFGIVLHDKWGRTSPVITGADKEIKIGENRAPGYLAQVELQALTPLSRFPSWAKYFSIVRTKNLTAQAFWYGRVNDVIYVREIDSDGSVPIPVFTPGGSTLSFADSNNTTTRRYHNFQDNGANLQYNETNTSDATTTIGLGNGINGSIADLDIYKGVKEVRFDISNLNQYGNKKPYIYQKGDYLKVYSRGINQRDNLNDITLDTPLRLSIKGTTDSGQTLICDSYEITSPSDVVSTYAQIEIVRPKTVDESDVFHYFGNNTYPIFAFPGATFKLRDGDVYSELVPSFKTEWLSKFLEPTILETNTLSAAAASDPVTFASTDQDKFPVGSLVRFKGAIAPYTDKIYVIRANTPGAMTFDKLDGTQLLASGVLSNSIPVIATSGFREWSFATFDCFMAPTDLELGEEWIRDHGNGIVEASKVKPLKTNRVLWTAKFIEGSKFNGLSEVIGSKDYPEEIGEIEVLANATSSVSTGNVMLICGQERSGSVYVEEALIKNPGQGEQLVAIDNFLSDINLFSTAVGCTDYKSFTQGDRVSYWVDSKQGIVAKYAQDGLTLISDIGMRNEFRDRLLFYEKTQTYRDPKIGKAEQGIISGYDPFNRLLLVKLIIWNGSTTFTYGYVYNEDINRWISTTTHPGLLFGQLNGRFLSYSNDYKLWLENSKNVDRCSWFGQAAQESYIEYVMNGEPEVEKQLAVVEQDLIPSSVSTPWNFLITNDRLQATYLIGKMSLNDIEDSITDFLAVHSGEDFRYRSGVYGNYLTPNPSSPADPDFNPATEGDSMVADVFYLKAYTNENNATGLRSVKVISDVASTGRKV